MGHAIEPDVTQRQAALNTVHRPREGEPQKGSAQKDSRHARSLVYAEGIPARKDFEEDIGGTRVSSKAQQGFPATGMSRAQLVGHRQFKLRPTSEASARIKAFDQSMINSYQ